MSEASIPDDPQPDPAPGSVPGDSAPGEAPGEAPGGDGPDAARQIALVKHGQRYIFRYAPGEESQVLASLVELAKDPDSELDWFDAAVLCHQMGKRLSQQLERMLKP
jgi:hypothetical protein